MYIVKPHPCTHPSMVEHSSEINRLLVSLAPVAQGGLEGASHLAFVDCGQSIGLWQSNPWSLAGLDGLPVILVATWGKRSPDLFCRWEEETVGSVAGVGVFSIYIDSGAQCQTLSIQGISEQLWLKVAVTIESGDGNRFGCIGLWCWGICPQSTGDVVPYIQPQRRCSSIFTKGQSAAPCLAWRQICRISHTANPWLLRERIQQTADSSSWSYKEWQEEYSKDSQITGRAMGANQPRKKIRICRKSPV